MKLNIKKVLTLLTIVFGLAACNSGASSSSSNEVNSSQNPASSSVFELDLNEQYSSTSWDENVVKMLEASVGDAASKIPTLKAPNYLTYIEHRDTEDLYGKPIQIDVTRIICSEQNTASVEAYGTYLEKNGFVYSMESDCYYGKASKTDCVYIFFHFFNKTGNLNLEIYRKTIRDEVWDDEVSTFIIGKKIPHIDCGAYEYYFDNYNIELYIYFVDIREQDITKYYSDLTAAGFTRISNEQYTVKKETNINITLEQGIDTFGDLYLMVRLSNEWPLYLLLGSTGSDLPKSLNGYYNGFFTSKDSYDNFYTQIEYEECEYGDFVKYCELLTDKNTYDYKYSVTEGNNPSSFESTEGNGTIYSAYFERTKYDIESLVDVLYSTALKRLIIIVWA